MMSTSARFVILILVLVLAGCSDDRIMEPEKPSGETSFAEYIKPEPIPSWVHQQVTLSPKKRVQQVAENQPAIPFRETNSQWISWLKHRKQRDLSVSSPTIPDGHFPFEFLSLNMNTGNYLTFSFENDFLNYSDRYFTNGLRLDFSGPTLAHFPLHRILFPYQGQGMNYFGITLVQHIFTPFTTKEGGIRKGDRPYAAYLYLGFYKISHDARREIRITSELDIGVIGPSSLGEQVQKTFHAITPENSEPLGWENQVKNGMVINYSLILSKMLFRSQHYEINILVGGKTGTLYDQLSSGFRISVGHLPSFLSHELLSRPQPVGKRVFSNLDVHAHVQVEGRLIGYDATLQGRMFAHTDPYTLSSSEILRGVMASSVGFQVSYGRFSLLAEQHLLSPEFKGGRWHKWIKLAVTAGF